MIYCWWFIVDDLLLMIYCWWLMIIPFGWWSLMIIDDHWWSMGSVLHLFHSISLSVLGQHKGHMGTWSGQHPSCCDIISKLCKFCMRRSLKGITWDSVCCGQTESCYLPSICQTFRPATASCSNKRTHKPETVKFHCEGALQTLKDNALNKNIFLLLLFSRSILFLMPMRCQQEKS